MITEQEEIQQICDNCNDKPCYHHYCADTFRAIINRQAAKIKELEEKMGIILHPQLRNSRFDFNARYIRFDEAQQISEFKAITQALLTSKNFEPVPIGDWVAYRRGTGGLWLYFVPEYDFRVPRERKQHKVEVKLKGAKPT